MWGGCGRKPNVTEIKQRNSAVSPKRPDHSYCRIPSIFWNVNFLFALFIYLFYLLLFVLFIGFYLF